MKFSTFIKMLTALTMSLFFIFPTLVSCQRSESENTSDSIADSTASVDSAADTSAPSYTVEDAKKIPAVYEALRAHFRLGTYDELTVEMLAEVTSISISPSKWESKRSDCCLVDVIINGDDKFCGALPVYMAESTHSRILKQLKDKYTPLEYTSAFNSWYMQIDPNAEGLSDSERSDILSQYPESAAGVVRVLNTDVPDDTMLWIFEYLYRSTDYLDDKHIKTNCKFDSSMFECYPNLKKLELFGFSIDGGTLDGVEVIITPHTTY